MLKKVCLLLVFWAIIPTLFLVPAQDSKESKEKAITIIGDVVPKADENGNMVFAGQVKNNSKALLYSIEIVFDILDSGGKILDTVTAPISGKQEGILEGGKIGSFEVKTKIHISTAGSYEYNITWKTFAK